MQFRITSPGKPDELISVVAPEPGRPVGSTPTSTATAWRSSTRRFPVSAPVSS